MTKPVIIRNGSKTVKNVKDKSKKLICLGNQYYISYISLDTPYFNVTSEDFGGVVTFNNTPIGVIGCTRNITGDNSIRVISIHNMTKTNPENGTLETETMYCPCSYMYNSRNLFKNYYTYAQTTYTESNFPVKQYQDGWIDYKTLLEISPQGTEHGYWKTDRVLENVKQKCPTAACAVWRYNPISSVLNTQGYWYLPSLYELFLEYLHKTTIDNGFLYIKNTYNVGLGRIPYRGGNGRFPETYWGSTYNYYQSTYGGNCCKMDVYSGFNTGSYYGTGADPGMAQAWLKLINVNNKWTLDPTYHID